MNLRQLIEASPLGFQLCGSRYLGTARPDSDWDYVATSTGDIHSFLADELGMYRMGQEKTTDKHHWHAKTMKLSGYYAGKYVRAIYEKVCEETGDRVQVAVVADAKYKMHIMQVLKKNAVLRAIDAAFEKSSGERNEFWTALYEIAGYDGNEEDDQPTHRPGPMSDDDITF